jgi:glutamyl-tRNA reductase
MNVVLVGLSHKTAPLEMRERMAFGDSHVGDALSALVDHDSIDEGLIISTCNRVELLASSPRDSEQCVQRMTSFLSEFHSISVDTLEPILYRHTGPEAVRHIFRVASSLDSMVVGEPQILGQVKEAYQHAVSAGTIGRVLSQVMNRALSVAKRVRNETGISLNPVSVSSVAVDLASKIFGSLTQKTVLLVGAGEMAELAARSLIEAGTSHFVVTNRTAGRAETIAKEFGGGAVSFEALYDVMPSADIVICSTGASEFVIRAAEAKRAFRSRKAGPILFIDISVPRNIDPEIAGLDHSFLFDIDDLQGVIQTNLQEREREAQAADVIIEAEVHQFIGHLKTLDIGPAVVEVKQLLADIALNELKRNRKHLGGLTPDQEEAIKKVLIPALVNKLSHPILVHLRTAARNGDSAAVLEELRKMIRID